MTYRPFLSHSELEAFLNGPAHLYDLLASVLGLEDLTTAEKRLAAARKEREDRLKMWRTHGSPDSARIGPDDSSLGDRDPVFRPRTFTYIAGVIRRHRRQIGSPKRSQISRTARMLAMLSTWPGEPDRRNGRACGRVRCGCLRRRVAGLRRARCRHRDHPLMIWLQPVKASLEEPEVAWLVRHDEPFRRVALSVDSLHCLGDDVHVRLGVYAARDGKPG